MHVLPSNAKRLSPTTGLSFCGNSMYSKSYKELGTNCLPAIPQLTHEVYSIPFTGKSLYSDSYIKTPFAVKSPQLKPKYYFQLWFISN